MSAGLKAVFLTTLAFLFLSSASAQIETGTIVGVVQDSTGGFVPNATVTLKEVATNVVREAHTDAQGAFNAQFMPLGTYSITVAATGFQTKTLTGITLQVDQTANLTISLTVGSVSQSVEITASAPLVDTTTSSLGQVIDNHEVLSMPLNGRNAFALGLLVGNTAPVQGIGTNLPFVGGSGRFSSGDVSLNGIDDNTFATAGSIGRQGYAIVPSVDAVEEFKVMTHNFAAEYGHAAGTIVSATLRAGTNQYHGAVFEFVRNDIFDANNFFTNRAGLPRTPFHQNQFGGTLGGPILHNRIFFFGDYQGTRISTRSGSSIQSVPPMAWRTGDFSSSPTVLYDPTTRHIGPNGTVVATSFLAETGANKIPASQINPTATAILGLIPAPNYGAANSPSNNYFYAPTQSNNTDQGDIRVDATITQKNHIFGSYSISNNFQPAVGAFPGWIGGGSAALNDNDQITVSDVYIFSSTLINELRAGYLYNNGTQPGGGTEGAKFGTSIGLALLPASPLQFPTISFSYSGAAANSTVEFTGIGPASLNLNTLQTRQLADNMSWTHGRHSAKWGADIRESIFNVLKGGPGSVYGAIFSSSSDAPGSGLPLADFLMGFPANTNGIPMIAKGRQHTAYFGGYIQDDWKTSNRLTLNLGLRYELYTQPVDQNNLGSLFDITTGQFAIPGHTPYSRAMVKGDHNDWGPRVGFSYQPFSKWVVRGGYGVFYAMRDQNQQTTQFSGNTPNIPTIVVPTITAAQTVKPPYTMNTPINTVPATDSLAGFTAASPYSGQIKTQSIQDALMPRLMQYNLDLQYQLNPTLLFEASYSGARGSHFASFFIDENQEPFSYALNGTNTQANRPFPYMGSSVLAVLDTSTQNYNALNLKAQQQLAHGLQFLANYTWQKNMETNGDGPDSFNQTATSVALYTYELSREKGVAPLNISQTASVSALYELPLGSGKQFLNVTGPLDYLLGGWVVNGILSLRTGFPSDINTNVVPPTFATYNVASCVAGVPKKLPNAGVDGYFNPAAFTVPLTATSTTGAQITEFGNCGHFPVTGPGSKNLDSSLFKNFYLSESHRMYLQFRAEAFNTTNTPTFSLPGASNVTLTCQGTPGSVCNAKNPNFGKLVNGSATGRQLQFAAKLYF
ncbi:MAG TPA: TonB-dependent receptor [Terracidiphilus sp.]|nr:TonB-dependent receptor [Terracidiphilus sp.]